MSIELMTESVISPPLAASWLVSAGLGWLMFLLSVFLILLVLVQRGKGGGLTGALGGPGGQSAFGSKAGDTFTAITAGFAIVWGLICAIAMYTLGVSPLTDVDDEFSTPEVPAVVDSDPESEAKDAMSGLGGLSGLLSEEANDAGGDAATDMEPLPESGDSELSDSQSSDQGGTPSAELNAPETSTTDDASADASDENSAETDAAEDTSSAE